MLNLLTDLPHRQRPPGFHQNHAACFRETRLASASPAVDQLQQVFPQDVVTKQIRQSRDCLLQGSDSFHDFSPLTHQLPKFFMGCLDHFLDMRILVAQKDSIARPVAATRSVLHYPTSEL